MAELKARTAGLAAAIFMMINCAGCTRPLAPSLRQIDLESMLRGGMGTPTRSDVQVQILERMPSKNANQKTDLAEHMFVGTGTKKDVKKAAALFREAAEEGSTKAQFCLAVLYGKGEGLPENAVEAMKWLLIAEQGDGSYSELARTYRLRLEKELTPGRLEIARALSDEWLSLHRPKNEKRTESLRGRKTHE